MLDQYNILYSCVEIGFISTRSLNTERKVSRMCENSIFSGMV